MMLFQLAHLKKLSPWVKQGDNWPEMDSSEKIAVFKTQPMANSDQHADANWPGDWMSKCLLLAVVY